MLTRKWPACIAPSFTRENVTVHLGSVCLTLDFWVCEAARGSEYEKKFRSASKNSRLNDSTTQNTKAVARRFPPNFQATVADSMLESAAIERLRILAISSSAASKLGSHESHAMTG